MAHSRLKAKPLHVRRFMPATQSLATGLVSAALEDLWMLLMRIVYLMQDIWEEALYSTAHLLRRY